jgi:SNF2 family DNA or RNA helicase
MLRRVKTDVVSELTRKTEVTVHCKLSSRQQAFYKAIKNKISLTELFEGNRGHLNEKKILNLMNIVIQLRKVYYRFYWGSVLSTSSFQKYNLSTLWEARKCGDS